MRRATTWILALALTGLTALPASANPGEGLLKLAAAAKRLRAVPGAPKAANAAWMIPYLQADTALMTSPDVIALLRGYHGRVPGVAGRQLDEATLEAIAGNADVLQVLQSLAAPSQTVPFVHSAESVGAMRRICSTAASPVPALDATLAQAASTAAWRQNLEPLITKEELAVRIKELGRQITADYQDGKPVHIVGVLNGSFPFYADLVREIDLPVQVHFMRVSSYEGTESTGGLTIHQDLEADVEGAHVILVEDIVDTGNTLSRLSANMAGRNAASVKVATLLDKPTGRTVHFDADYVAFTVPDAFIVGYGLDYNGMYRNLPEISVLTAPPE